MFVVQLFAICMVLAVRADADQLNICQDEFSIREGFFVYQTNCRDYEDDAALAGANFDEDHALWIRNGTIADIGQLLNGSLYNITHLKITDLSAEGSTPIPVFPIESMRFSVLELTNDGIERLEIPDPDYRLTHLDVSGNKLEDLGNVKLLTALKALKANRNRLVQVDLTEFENMTELATLSLAGNRIEVISASRTVALLKMQSIDISDNWLWYFHVANWHFPQLASFHLYDNKLYKIGGLRGKFPKVWDIAMGGTNNWYCEWFDKVLQYLKQDRKFAMKMFGDPLNCTDQSRMDGFICCQTKVIAVPEVDST